MKSRDHAGDRQASVVACTESHRRLESAIARLTDEVARRPSLLPGWSVAHVLTHLARNADSHVRMLAGAERGEVLDQYEGGVAGRRADIDSGAARSAADIVADVAAANARLEQQWARSTEVAWSGHGRTLGGEISIDLLPGRRWVEAELHRIDLGPMGDRAYTFADLPSDLVGIETRRLTALWASRQPMGLATLPAAALQLTPDQRLAWLVGRLDVAGLPPADVFG